MIYNLKEQDVNSGGSGCGCSASVLCSHILKQMKSGKLNKVLFVATGALMSPTSSKQGQPIPGIAHAVLLEK
jgi:stage V sporulation protein AD